MIAMALLAENFYYAEQYGLHNYRTPIVDFAKINLEILTFYYT